MTEQDEFGYVPDPNLEQDVADANKEREAIVAEQEVEQEQGTEVSPQAPVQPAASQPTESSEPTPETPAEGEEEESQGLLQEGAIAAATPILALADFGSDLTRLTGLTGFDDWWDENSPRSQNKFLDGTRGFLKAVLPEVGIFLATRGRIKKTGLGAGMGWWQKRSGELALEAGVTTVTTSVLEETSTDKNWGNMLQDWFGLDIPWAVQDADNPDVRYKKNVMAATGFTFGVGALGLGFAGRQRKRITLDDGTKIDIDSTPESALEEVDQIKNAQDGEAVARYAADPDGVKGYDPFVNNTAELQAKAIQGADADPIGAAVDQTLIANNVTSTNGRPRGFLTPGQKAEYKALSTEGRIAFLNEIAKGWERIKSIEAGKVKLKKTEIKGAIDNLADTIIQGRGDLSSAQDLIKSYKTSVKTISNNVQTEYLSEEGRAVVAGAINKLLPYVDGTTELNSALFKTSTASEVEAAAIAAEVLEEGFDVSRQQEMIMEGLDLLLTEDNTNRFIAGYSLQALRVAKNVKDPEVLADAMQAVSEEFETGLTKAQQKSKEAVAEYKRIAKENPEYLRPFSQLYSYTNGKVDTQLKMMKWAENKLGFARKAFFDGESQVPSYIIQGMVSARYNSVLMGLAPIRAVAGNGLQLVLKPLTTIAGSAIAGDSKGIKRAIATYGGFSENFKRGLKQMANDWRFAVANPEAAGRQDVLGMAKEQRLDEFEMLSQLAENARQEGNPGMTWAYNMAQMMSAWNNNPIVRVGVNAMYAIDGFTTSFLASGTARSRAYDELVSATGGNFTMDEFNALQKTLYDQMFDANGVINDDAVKYASGEIALNLESETVNKLNSLLDRVPIAKAIFMFPRTGVNALKMVNTFSPTSALGLAFGKQKQVLKATTRDEKIAALAAHGIANPTDAAFNALRAEYIGRQLAGTTVTMGAAMWALEGNLTGNGPADGGERARMIKMGWQPLSIKNPITGEWVSYRGFEPFDTFLGLTADIVFEGKRLDQAITENMLQKVAFSLSANVSNKTFLSGFEPITALLGGDFSGFSRLAISTVDPLIPARGVRSILNNVITPQLKDVEGDVLSQFKRANRFLFPGDNVLKDYKDLYTGKVINDMDPMTAALNAFLPYFKTNSGMEPWRQWLLGTGWDNLQQARVNPLTKQELTPSERQWVNNWIAENMGLDKVIQNLMTRDDAWFDKEVKRYAKQRGFQSQRDFPVNKTATHIVLDEIHNEAFNLAWNAYEGRNEAGANAAAMTTVRDTALGRGETSRAQQAQNEVKQYLEESKKQGY
jgi:hypothetical protein